MEIELRKASMPTRHTPSITSTSVPNVVSAERFRAGERCWPFAFLCSSRRYLLRHSWISTILLEVEREDNLYIWISED